MLSDWAIHSAIHGIDRAPAAAVHQSAPDIAFAGLTIEPYAREHLNPASYDLTLSPVFRFIKMSDRPLDVGNMESGHTQRISMDEGSYHFPRAGFVLDDEERTLLLYPGAFMLGSTNEVVHLPSTLAARVEGKSSLGRLGLAVHITAGFIDPGFHGSITLEIANLSPRPIILRPDMRIAQIAFNPMDYRVVQPYGVGAGHYQDQPAGEPVESRYGR